MPGSTDLRSLADEDLMQLIRRGDARAFEVDLRPPRRRRLLARLSHGRHARRRRGRRAGGVPVVWRSGARYERARGSVRTWVLGHRPPPRDRRAAARARCTTAPRAATRASRSGSSRGERTDAEVARREEARDRARGDGHAARRAVQVIELAYFGGFTHTEIAEMLDDAGRHGEGPHAAGAEEAARRSCGRGGDVAMSATAITTRGPTPLGAYLLGALPEDEARRLRAPSRRAAPAAAPRSSELRVAADALPAGRAARRAAARAQGAHHGRGRARGRAAAPPPAPRPTAPQRRAARRRGSAGAVAAPGARAGRLGAAARRRRRAAVGSPAAAAATTVTAQVRAAPRRRSQVAGRRPAADARRAAAARAAGRAASTRCGCKPGQTPAADQRRCSPPRSDGRPRSTCPARSTGVDRCWSPPSRAAARAAAHRASRSLDGLSA